MKNSALITGVILFAILLFAAVAATGDTPQKAAPITRYTTTPLKGATSTQMPDPQDIETATETPADTETATPTDTDTPAATNTSTETPSATFTPSSTVTPSATPTPVMPFVGAPLCMSHDGNVFHTLWNSVLGCHYDHEHGQSPFTQEVTAYFSELGNLQELACGLQISHCVPSSPMENAMKHGGYKWQVTQNPNGCKVFTGIQASAITGVDWAAIQYHNFGNYWKVGILMDEFGSRTHSVEAALRQCKPGNPTDFGYIYLEQLQDFGPRLRYYQGPRLDYADNPPFYPVNLGPYFNGHCVFGLPACRTSLAQALANRADTIWTSQPNNVPGSKLFMELFRGRDTYQMVDGNDQTYPFTSYWLCSSDGGTTYNPVGCAKNNTATYVQEIGGEIPAAWDNLEGFDTDSRVGRVTGEGYVTRFGNLVLAGCIAYGIDCQPIKLLSAFVGKYGAHLIDDKVNQFTPAAQPERDICFTTAGLLINCDLPGAIPSGWVGAEN